MATKDLTVHLATVLVLSSQPDFDRSQARRAIDEVVARLGAVPAVVAAGG